MGVPIEIIADSIGIWKNRLSSKFCQDVIAIFDSKEALARAEYEGEGDIHDSYEHGGLLWRNDRKRIDISTTMSLFRSMDPYVRELESVLHECSHEYFKWFQQRQMEMDPTADRGRESWEIDKQPMVYKMQKTYAGGGFCQFHHEQGPDPYTIIRYGVWMLYLNDVTRGGTTDFPVQNVRLAPTEGTFVLWPAAYTHPHRGSPDLDETKYIVTGWFEHPQDWKKGDCGCED